MEEDVKQGLQNDSTIELVNDATLETEPAAEPEPAYASEPKVEASKPAVEAAKPAYAPEPAVKAEKPAAEKKHSMIDVIFTALALGSGLHYIGYILRTRYFGWLETQPFDDALAHVLMYFGHAIFLAILIIYAIGVKRDRKYVFSFAHGKIGRNILFGLAGALTGFLMMGVCILAAVIHGDLVVKPAFTISGEILLLAVGAVLLQSSEEEIEARGFVFGKMNNEGVPMLIAVLASACYFAFLHAMNPGFGLIPMLSLTLVGILYALSYYYFESIWFVCTTHMMWNFTQDFLFGLPNSGKAAVASVLQGQTTSARTDFFFDEVFGIEGSTMALIVNVVTIVLVVIIGSIMKRKRDQKNK